MIRPEKYQYNWKPKTKSKEDLELVRNLEEIKERFVDLIDALIHFMEYGYFDDKFYSEQ